MPIRLPMDHSNLGSHTSAMAREAEALRRSVVAANEVPPPSLHTHTDHTCLCLPSPSGTRASSMQCRGAMEGVRKSWNAPVTHLS